METFHNNVMLGESGTYSTNWEEYHTYLKQLIIEANFSIKEPNNIEYITSLSDSNSIGLRALLLKRKAMV